MRSSITWVKGGRSPNPGGRPRTIETVEALAKEHTTAAIDELARLMRSSPVAAVRLAAANALLDRAWGKPRQQLDATERQETRRAEDMTDDELAANASGARLIGDPRLQ
jgi:hypothetical protein